MYKVRFHLGAGENYMKWQVDDGNTVKYYSPKTTTLQMFDARLINKRKIAEKIFNGSNKDVCAWISCKLLYIHEFSDTNIPNYMHSLGFNPRIKPYWVNSIGDNIDGEKYFEIVTSDRKLFGYNTL